ncbi:MAG: M23 family metallopeptidase, partial [Thermodesulfobacteriota bacterium]
VRDGRNEKRTLTSYSGDDVKTKMQLLGDKTSTNAPPPGQSGIIFINFAVENEREIPRELSHRLSLGVPGGMPPGFIHFAGLPPGTEEYLETQSPIDVGSADAIVLGPPLEGKGWVAADGCCESHRHIRAIMPINGKLYIAQRFAIDWEMINDDRRIYVGDSKDVSSYFAYGKKVLAVADAMVVTAVDGYKDQVPGELPSNITLEEADGNHVVLDLGNGRYALYAHLRPGSLRVKTGDMVKRGQILGLVGNTGNSSAPHLHFHVMSSESTLGSNGLPYVIDEFDLIGKAPSTEAFDKAEIEGVPLEVISLEKPGIHKNELPLDLSVVKFPVSTTD